MLIRQFHLLLMVVVFVASACDDRRQSTTASNVQVWPNASDERATKIIEKRWETGSKVTLGHAGDEERIRNAILEHMGNWDNKHVGEIRWMSADEVMVYAYWGGGLAGAGYHYVLQREASGWNVVKQYEIWIS